MEYLTTKQEYYRVFNVEKEVWIRMMREEYVSLRRNDEGNESWSLFFAIAVKHFISGNIEIDLLKETGIFFMTMLPSKSLCQREQVQKSMMTSWKSVIWPAVVSREAAIWLQASEASAVVELSATCLQWISSWAETWLFFNFLFNTFHLVFF